MSAPHDDERVPAPGTREAGTRDAGSRTITLDLFGQRIRVVSDADEDRIHEVMDLVKERLGRIRAGAKKAPPEQTALLTALNLAEELVEERAKSERLRKQVRDRSLRLLASIDTVSKELEARMTSSGTPTETPNQSQNSLPGT